MPPNVAPYRVLVRCVPVHQLSCLNGHTTLLRANQPRQLSTCENIKWESSVGPVANHSSGDGDHMTRSALPTAKSRCNRSDLLLGAYHCAPPLQLTYSRAMRLTYVNCAAPPVGPDFRLQLKYNDTLVQIENPGTLLSCHVDSHTLIILPPTGHESTDLL